MLLFTSLELIRNLFPFFSRRARYRVRKRKCVDSSCVMTSTTGNYLFRKKCVGLVLNRMNFPSSFPSFNVTNTFNVNRVRQRISAEAKPTYFCSNSEGRLRRNLYFHPSSSAPPPTAMLPGLIFNLSYIYRCLYLMRENG